MIPNNAELNIIVKCFYSLCLGTLLSGKAKMFKTPFPRKYLLDLFKQLNPDLISCESYFFCTLFAC